jgi:hypothetical protein
MSTVSVGAIRHHEERNDVVIPGLLTCHHEERSDVVIPGLLHSIKGIATLCSQ